MGLIDIARNLWLQIRNETVIGANTATRVGDAGIAILDVIDTKVETIISPAYILGQTFGTGKVGYILQPTDQGYDVNIQKGLMVDTSSSETLKTWSAAVIDGQLPTETQLLQIYTNKDAIGGFHPELYWTSTEDNETHAFCINIGAGYPTSEFKTNAYRTVRVWKFENSLLPPDSDEIVCFADSTGKRIKSTGKKLSDLGSNAIESIRVNGVTQAINPDKSVDLQLQSSIVTDNTITGAGTTLSPLSVRMLELPMQNVVSGSIILENPNYVYKISTADNLNVTLNTSLVDMTQYVKFYMYVKLNAYKTLTFPSNWFFANLDIPSQVGEYMYECTSSDNGTTWHLQLRYKNIATVGIDQNGNTIIGAKTLYVDGDLGLNTNTGLTWATAFKDIQPAIDLANSGDAVFVKGSLSGIKYLPTTLRTVGDNKSKSFVMKTGVNIYGGFSGVEQSLYERPMNSYLQVLYLPTGIQNIYINVPKNRTILSGEIAGNSIINTGQSGNQFTTASISNNAYTVVYADVSGNTVMNGFEITGGNYPSSLGGGISATNTVFTISNCAVYNNQAYYGGGVARCTAINCVIYNNTAAGYNGGGTFATTSQNCAIYNNVSAGGVGGGCCGGYTTNCAVYSNACSGDGGGTYSTTNFSSSIYNNTANRAGGLEGGSSTNCSIYGNSALGNGGGVDASGTNTYLYNCAIYNNSAGYNGGGIGDLYGLAVNCSIYNNYAAGNGGGIAGADQPVINCSIVNNKSGVLGGGIWNTSICNCVVYGNRATSGAFSNSANTNSYSETYCAFENETRTGTGNISLSINNTGDSNSPCFKGLSLQSGIVDISLLCNLDIQAGSYLIDKGLNSAITSGYSLVYDLLSRHRFVGNIDIGACENQK